MQSQHRKRIMNDSFHAAVRLTPLYGIQSRSQFINSLMMGAVNTDFRAIEQIETGAFQNNGIMVLVTLLVLMKMSSGKVLGDGAAEGNINQLHTFTNPQYRHAMLDSIFQSGQLKNIQLCINLFGTFVAFTKKGRSDIAAARQ